MKKNKLLLLTAIIITGMISCRKIQQLPAVPSIKYLNFTVFDTTDILGNKSKGGRLRFHFEDGDGDLGLNAPVDSLQDSTNLFLTLYRKTGGIMVPATASDPLKPAPYRIPYMERTGQNKILKGTISVTFLYLFYSPTDTIKYDFYIIDRALNQSNVASTNQIILSANSTY